MAGRIGKRSKHIGPVLLILCLCLLAPGHARAQDNGEEAGTEDTGLSMEVKAGFAGYMRQGCYLPIRVTIENAGRARRGQIRVVSQDPGHPLTAVFTASCDIPANSRKAYSLYPYVLNDDPTPSLYVQYVERIPVLTRQVDLQPLRQEEQMWVEVADEGYDFAYLSGLSLTDWSSFTELSHYINEERPDQSRGRGYPGSPYSSGGTGQTILYNSLRPQMVGVHPRDLPDRPEGYQGVNGVILNSRRFYELSEDQQMALAEWVISGGAVIVWLGDDPARYQGSFLTGAVDGSGWQGPSACTETPLRTTLRALRTIPGFLGQREVLGSYPVTYAPQSSARILLAEGNVPVLQHLRLGRGDILLSGLDLASLKSSSILRLNSYFAFMIGYLASMDDRLRPIIKYNPQFRTGYGYNLRASANPYVVRSLYWVLREFNNALKSDSLTALPPLRSIALFLAVYVILVGPINYYVLLRIRRREWLWYTIPVLVAAFCLLSYGWALGTKGHRLLLTRLNISDAFPEQGLSWEYSAFGLFSPAARRYDVRLASEGDLIRELELPSLPASYSVPGGGGIQASGPADNLNLVQDGRDGGAYVRSAYIRIWSEEHFESEGAGGFPGMVRLEGVTLRNNHLRGTMHVSLDFDLEGATLLYCLRGDFVGFPVRVDGESVLRNASVDFDLFIDLRGSEPEIPVHSRPGISGKAVDLREACLQVLSSRPMDASGESELILAGWRSGPGERALSSPRSRAATEETLVLIHLPLRIESGDFSVEGARGTILGVEAGNIELKDSGDLVLTDGRMYYSVSFPPVVTPDRQPNSLYINVSIRSGRQSLGVQAFDHREGVWTALPAVVDSHDRVTYRLGNLGRFLAPDHRTLLLIVEGDPDRDGDVISLSGISVNAS